MKVFNVISIILLILCAALQYNDPDPYIWIPIYLYAAVLCYLAMQKKYNPALYAIGMVVYVAYAVYLFFDKTGVLEWANAHQAESLVQSMKAEKPWIEETREFGGLVIVLVILLVNMFWLRKVTKAKAS